MAGLPRSHANEGRTVLPRIPRFLLFGLGVPPEAHHPVPQVTLGPGGWRAHDSWEGENLGLFTCAPGGPDTTRPVLHAAHRQLVFKCWAADKWAARDSLTPLFSA